MPTKRKHLFSTWADAEAAYNASSRAAILLDVALTQAVIGSVRWLQGEPPQKVGLCKLEGSHGGVVILVERGMVGARYLDEWVTDVKSRPAPPKDRRDAHKKWLEVQQLANTALKQRERVLAMAAERATGCERMPLPPVVDQDVRTY